MADNEPAAGDAAYVKVVAKAWSDPAFKAKLLADPVAALTAAGASVPAGVSVKVVENTDKLVHFVIPARPAEGELSDEALAKVAAGATQRPFPPNYQKSIPLEEGFIGGRHGDQ